MSLRLRVYGLLAASLVMMLIVPSLGHAQGSSTKSTTASKCVLVEVYVDSEQDLSDAALAAAENVSAERPGIRLVVRPVNDNEKNQQRLKAIADYFKFPEQETPVIYSMMHVVRGQKTQDAYASQLRNALTMEVFVRQGCSKCASAKRWLPTLAAKYPGVRIVYRDIVTDANSRNELNRLTSEYRTAATSTPVFHFCKSMVVGFDYRNTPSRLEGKLRRWMHDCPKPDPKKSADLNSSLHKNGSQQLGVASSKQAHEVAYLLPF